MDMSLFTPKTEDYDWFCPLLNKEIEDGYCYDVNYQRLGCFKPDVLLEVKLRTGKSTEQISQVCDNCLNNPLQNNKRFST